MHSLPPFFAVCSITMDNRYSSSIAPLFEKQESVNRTFASLSDIARQQQLQNAKHNIVSTVTKQPEIVRQWLKGKDIGNNVNQIAKAVNSDIAGTGTFDKVKLLHLLISIDQQLRELRPDDR